MPGKSQQRTIHNTPYLLFLVPTYPVLPLRRNRTWRCRQQPKMQLMGWQQVSSCYLYIPIPDPQTPWEAIFEFRSDPANKRAFANLRAYTSKLARSALSPRELKDEIEADYLNLRPGLDRNRVKYRMKALEVFVVSAASVIENFAKLRFSEFVKPIFELKTTRQDCLEERLLPSVRFTMLLPHTGSSPAPPRRPCATTDGPVANAGAQAAS